MKTNNKIVLLILSISMLFSIGCGKEINPNAPQSGIFNSLPTAKASTVIVPLSVNINELQGTIERQIPRGVVYRQPRIRESNTTQYEFTISRHQPIKLDANGNILRFAIPLQVNAQGWYTACGGYWHNGRCCSAPNPFGSCIRGITHTRSGTTEVQVMAYLNIQTRIDENYNPLINIRLDERLTNRPHLTIGILDNLIRFNISISSRVREELEEQILEQQDKIHAEIKKTLQKVNIKQELAKHWQHLDSAYALADTDLYLHSSPKNVLFKNVYTEKGTMHMILGITTHLTVNDTAQHASHPLPEKLTLIKEKSNKGNYDVYLPLQASFTTITKALQKEVNGNEYEKDGHKVQINDVDVKGIMITKEKSGLLIITDLTIVKGWLRNIRAKLYITALPSYDKEKKIISISDIAITAETNKALIAEGISWIGNHLFLKDIKEKLRYDFSEKYDEQIEKLRTQIDTLSIDPLTLYGSLDTIDIQGIYITENTLSLVIQTTGDITSKPIILK